MSQSKTTIEATEASPEDWIDDGVSFLQAKVTIYRDPGVYAEYGPLLERIDALEAEIADLQTPAEDAPAGDRALGGGDEPMTVARSGDYALGERAPEPARLVEARAELDEALARATVLYEQYAENVEVWTLRRLNPEELQDVADEVTADLGPVSEEPRLAKNAKPQARAAWSRRHAAWEREMRAWIAETNLRSVQRATVGVTVRGEAKPTPSLEGMRRVKARPGGAEHVSELARATDRLFREGVDIVAPHRAGA